MNSIIKQLLMVLVVLVFGLNAQAAEEAKPAETWEKLFDGKTLDGWKAPNFGGQGEVTVEKGAIVMPVGSDMTGVTYTRKIPRTNYELAYEGKRIDGTDFFATATFPVDKKSCSFVTGGWGGTVIGLSCVDFYDASENPTTKYYDFKEDQWYKFRIRVSDTKIEVWIDDEKVVGLLLEGHKISIRDEVDLCQPLGFSSWCSVGAVRNIRLRQLSAEEVAQIAADKSDE